MKKLYIFSGVIFILAIIYEFFIKEQVVNLTDYIYPTNSMYPDK